MVVVWILGISAGLSFLYVRNKYLVYSLLLIFISFNLVRFSNHPVNESGYVQKNALAGFIASDAKLHNYPCVAVSYITSPGYELGYRYIFYLHDLHVNQPSSQSPVYTIVFPHSEVDRIDKSFGALGLIYPDYERYNQEEDGKSCQAENANLMGPMFGFTR